MMIVGIGTGYKYSCLASIGTEYKCSSFTYKIIRRNRKTIGIKITKEGEIIVISPFSISDEIISNIIKKKENWILSKVTWIKQTQLISKGNGFKTGEKLLYFGKKVTLEIRESIKDRFRVTILDDKFVVYTNKSEKEDVIKNAVIKFYKEEARKVFTERTNFYSEVIAVRPQKITIKDQKTVWGSCSSKRNINYNYRLIMAPLDIIDYVVVHELCHLVYMDHSKEYWDTVDSVLPDYKIRRQWLKVNGVMLKI